MAIFQLRGKLWWLKSGLFSLKVGGILIFQSGNTDREVRAGFGTRGTQKFFKSIATAWINAVSVINLITFASASVSVSQLPCLVRAMGFYVRGRPEMTSLWPY